MALIEIIKSWIDKIVVHFGMLIKKFPGLKNSIALVVNPPLLDPPNPKIFESLDDISLSWTPNPNLAKAEFYYIEGSPSSSFSGKTRKKVYHGGGSPNAKQIAVISAPVVFSQVPKYYFRIIAGYLTTQKKEILSIPSNVVDVEITPIPTPQLKLVTTTAIYSGMQYEVEWTPVAKAVEYVLEQYGPDPQNPSQYVTIPHTCKNSPRLFIAPALESDESYEFQIKAIGLQNSTKVDITDWSNKIQVAIKHVDPPLNLKIDPLVVQPDQTPEQYAFSWDKPQNGPPDDTKYMYVIKEDTSELQSQSSTSKTFWASKVPSIQTKDYDVRALYINNPMTLFAEKPVTLTIKPPPQPPPPQISSVNPLKAPKGDLVQITGSNLDGANVKVYLSGSAGIVYVNPTSHTPSLIEFVVPSGASFKTVEVCVDNGTPVSKPFTVARKDGAFVKCTGLVDPTTHPCSCNNHLAEVIYSSYLNQHTAVFKENGSNIIQPITNFKPFTTGGLGFSQGCIVGVTVAEISGSLAAGVNFYNLGITQDSGTNPGDKITTSPILINASTLLQPKGYEVYFSPDETIVALYHRHKNPSGSIEGQVLLYDLLKGESYPEQSPLNYTASLSVNKKNEIVIVDTFTKILPIKKL